MLRVAIAAVAVLLILAVGVAAQDDFKSVNDDTRNQISSKPIKVPYHDPAASFYVYVPNEMVLKLKTEPRATQFDSKADAVLTGNSSLDELNRKYGVRKFVREFPDMPTRAQEMKSATAPPDMSRYYVMDFNPKYDLREVRKAYEAVGEVELTQPIGVHPIYEAIPNDTYFSSDQWNFKDAEDNDIDATDAWMHETGDATVVVACLDSGVQYNHHDLGNASPWINGNMWINTAEYGGAAGVDDDGNGFVDDWIGWDFVNGASPCYSGEDCFTQDNEPTDFNGHGTHVAGIMGAITNNSFAVAGLAGGWNATPNGDANGIKVMACRIGWSAPHPLYGEVGYVRMDFAAQAMYYAVNNGAVAINCSWGSSNSGGIAAAVDYATAHGVAVVAAAGNDNSQVADYLGNRTDVIDVCATDDTDHKASFSNYGTWVDIAAPGVDILSTYSNHYATNYVAWISGTSQAAPHVTGAFGFLKSFADTLTRDQMETLLLDNTDYIDDINPSYAGRLGSGRLNIYKALDAVEAPEVTVIQPNGGEVLYIGQHYTVMWDASDNVGIESTSIDYSVNSGVDWTHLADLTGNPGEWDWVVTGPPSDQCRMRVTCTDAVGLSGGDMSDEDFCPPYKVATPSFAIKGGPAVPHEYALRQNYPNPFNPTTEISFDLPERSVVTLEVFNILGQKVVTLVNGVREAGTYTESFGDESLPSGIYLYRLKTDNYVASRKMIMIK